MKKLIFSLAFLWTVSDVHAQNLKDSIPENSLLSFYLRFTALFMLFALVGYFVVTIIQQFMNYQLRKKIIEHNVPATLAEQLLSTSKKESGKWAMKWMLLTTALALGVLISGLVQPFGFHSVVIILFSLAVGFLFYFFYVRRTTL